jgi:hypothetical protein
MLGKIQDWYREAAVLHGDHWSGIEAYVAQKLAAAGSADRSLLLDQVRALLGSPDESLH